MSLPRYRAAANRYAAARRAAAILRGDCQVCCKRPTFKPDASRCAQCHDWQTDANRSRLRGGSPYVPLESLLGTPRARILRAMRWLDWTTPTGLFELLDLPVSDRQRYRQTLNGAHTYGLVDRRDIYGTNEFRITEQGKAALRRLVNSYEQRLGEGVAA